MADKYIAFVPAAWDFTPTPEHAGACLQALLDQGILQGDPSDPASLRNGPSYQKLWVDTDPKPAREGDGKGCDAGNMVVRIDQGELRGYAGDNLEPVACNYCNAELPYDEAQDSFIALAEGEGLDSERLQMECFHCGKHNPAVSGDFGRSGGFSHFALVFDGETSNRVEPQDEGMSLLAEHLGTPIKFIQVFGW